MAPNDPSGRSHPAVEFMVSCGPREEGRPRRDDTCVPLDTSRSAHEVQRDVYLRMGGAGRVAVMFRLTDAVRRLAMAGIRARHPEYDEELTRRAYARLVLGDAAARAVWPGRELVDP